MSAVVYEVAHSGDIRMSERANLDVRPVGVLQ